MALTFDQIVDEVVAVAPEVTTTLAAGWLNDRAGRLVAKSQGSQKVEALDVTTTADQSIYALDTDTVDLRALRIGDAPYQRVSMEVIWDLEAGRRLLVGEGGVFAPYSATQIYLYPAPESTGDTITVIQSAYPADSTYGGTDNLAVNVPKQLRHFARAGAFADAYRYVNRDDLAERFEAEFQAGQTEFYRARRTQIGSGPAKVRVLQPGEY